MDSESAFDRREFLSVLGGTAAVSTMGASAAATGSVPTAEQTLAVSFLGRYSAGAYDEGAAEISAYDPGTQRLFVVNGNVDGIDVLDVSNPSAPSKEATINVGMSGANNVSTYDGMVIAAVEADAVDQNGAVVFYDAADLTEITSVEAGPLPDMVTVTDDGNYVLTANEAEPASDYSVDPKGSVSVIDISGGVESATVRTAGFEAYDGREDELRERGIRLYGPGSSTSMDLEPEYVATAGGTAYVTLQENNALAIVDIEAAEVTGLKALGYKDFSLPENALDAIEDGDVDITTQPLHGMYQPDSIRAYEAEGETYLVTANEGDAREYDALFETGVLKNVGGSWGLDTTEDDGDNIDVEVDSSGFDDGVLDALAGLEATAQYGDVDGDGAIEELHLFGARSVAVHDAEGNRVYESGDTLEQIVADEQPEQFNSDDDENGMDSESVASGPEPEGMAVGTVAETPYAFVGLEEVSAVTTFDVSDPTAPAVVDYINTRDFSVGPEDEIEEGTKPADAAGDLSPEGITFVPRSASPIATPMIAVTYEVSGTTSLYAVEGPGENTIPHGPGQGGSPGSTDDDDTYEDIDGDGDGDEDDVVALLNGRDSQQVQANSDRYDHDGDGSVGLSDATALWRKLMR